MQRSMNWERLRAHSDLREMEDLQRSYDHIYQLYLPTLRYDTIIEDSGSALDVD